MLEELNQQMSQRIHHEVEHAIESPANINRVVGEAMRHIGSFLEMNSTAYLPIRPDEILVTPNQIHPDATEAVLLVTRVINSDNSFTILSNSKTVDDKRIFDITAYKTDNFNLNKTKFVKIPDAIGNEIIRQLNELLTNDGAILLQAVVVKDYFKLEPEVTEDSLFNSDVQPTVEVKAPSPEPVIVPGKLPPVTNETLL